MSHEQTALYQEPAVTQEEHDAAFALGRNLYCKVVLRWYLAGRLPHSQLNAYLVDAWVAAEWPRDIARSLDMGDSDIVRMMHHAGFLTDDPEGEKPSDPMRLYRGCTEHGAEGFSWTSNPETARRFAHRERDFFFRDSEEYGEPCIIIATISAAHILGKIAERRGEQEYIVNPIGAADAIAQGIYLTGNKLDTPDIDAAADASLQARARWRWWKECRKGSH